MSAWVFFLLLVLALVLWINVWAERERHWIRHSKKPTPRNREKCKEWNDRLVYNTVIVFILFIAFIAAVIATAIRSKTL